MYAAHAVRGAKRGWIGKGSRHYVKLDSELKMTTNGGAGDGESEV